MIPIDPFAALDAVQSAIKLVKKASQTANDIGSLAPMLGRYFDAKVDAIKVVSQAKSGGFKGSAMGKALELEMALEGAREFEESLKNLFFSSGKMDVWVAIKKRAAAMEAEAAKEIARAKAEAAKKKKEEQEMLEWVLMIGGTFMVVGLIIWGGIYFYLNCNKYGCH
jgi:phosphate/sulfate permease